MSPDGEPELLQAKKDVMTQRTDDQMGGHGRVDPVEIPAPQTDLAKLRAMLRFIVRGNSHARWNVPRDDGSGRFEVFERADVERAIKAVDDGAVFSISPSKWDAIGVEVDRLRAAGLLATSSDDRIQGANSVAESGGIQSHVCEICYHPFDQCSYCSPLKVDAARQHAEEELRIIKKAAKAFRVEDAIASAETPSDLQNRLRAFEIAASLRIDLAKADAARQRAEEDYACPCWNCAGVAAGLEFLSLSRRK